MSSTVLLLFASDYSKATAPIILSPPPRPPPIGEYPGQTGGFHLVFTQFRFPGSRGIHLFVHGFAIQCGGWVGVWRGFHSWFVTSFRRMGSGCMFTILRMWQTKCMRKDARSSGSPLLVREDGRGIKVNTPGMPQLGGGWRGGSNDWCITCCFISKGNTTLC